MTALVTRGNRNSGAIFSRDGHYRFELWRNWGTGKKLAFIGLNPSTADEIRSDPTVTRCINYAKRDGYGGMVMLNIFALRSTDPTRLLDNDIDPVGADNDRAIRKWLKRHPDVLAVACWGNHRSIGSRGVEIVTMAHRLLHPLRCLGLNQNGSPKHPLYLRGDTEIRLFRSNEMH